MSSNPVGHLSLRTLQAGLLSGLLIESETKGTKDLFSWFLQVPIFVLLYSR